MRSHITSTRTKILRILKQVNKLKIQYYIDLVIEFTRYIKNGIYTFNVTAEEESTSVQDTNTENVDGIECPLCENRFEDENALNIHLHSFTYYSLSLPIKSVELYLIHADYFCLAAFLNIWWNFYVQK